MHATNDDASMKPGSCTIRRIEPCDIEALVLLCVDHARYERAEYKPEGKADLLKQALFTQPTRLLAWVAKIDGRLAGYTSAASEFSTWSAREFWHMDCLFVVEEYRGNGVGAALLATIVQFAREQGYDQVQWQTPEWNERARKFYRREGAAEKHKVRFTLNL
ncbi:GNAT family N-acetyltransferase [Pinirhizobacter soli]|uniref:GNAT family N-acetyltransferase n=1 Tax=Pinirhizobacter soli TaxID=2786953 RepID=UPI002029FDD3|nr:GNAT family N-acetyltransferase [Pinirhizobacter soli]